MHRSHRPWLGVFTAAPRLRACGDEKGWSCGEAFRQSVSEVSKHRFAVFGGQ